MRPSPANVTIAIASGRLRPRRSRIRTGWSSATAISSAAPVNATASIAFMTASTIATTTSTPKATVKTVFSVTCDGRTSLSSADKRSDATPTRAREQLLLRRTAPCLGAFVRSLTAHAAVEAVPRSLRCLGRPVRLPALDLADARREIADVVAQLGDLRAVWCGSLQIGVRQRRVEATKLVVRESHLQHLARYQCRLGRPGSRAGRAAGEQHGGRGESPHGATPGPCAASAPARNTSASSLSLITSAA